MPLALRLCLFACLGPALAPAAEFRALSWEQTIPDVSFSGAARSATIRISPDRFTPWQTLPAKRELIEFRQKPEVPPVPAVDTATATTTPAPAPPSAALPEVIGTVAWPAGVERALLIFVPTPPGSALPYQVFAVPETARDAEPPALRLFNYSTQEVAVKTGTGDIVELPTSSSYVSNERPANSVSLLLMAEKTADGWRAVVNQNIALPKDRTAYFFVRNATPDPLEPNKPIVTFKLIYDRFAPRPAAEAKP